MSKTDREIVEAATRRLYDDFELPEYMKGIWRAELDDIISPTVHGEEAFRIVPDECYEARKAHNFSARPRYIYTAYGREFARYIAHFNPSKVAEMLDEIEQLKAERDEARREVCHLCYLHIDGDPVAKTQESVAKHRGWDCFQE